MKIYAIIPARSGSKGYPDKNIKLINGKPLIGYAIDFAKKLHCDKIICSTDSLAYKSIAESLGAEVPFLRSEYASADNAMEEHILQDLYDKFIENNIDLPDILVWLRPTFLFRDANSVLDGIALLKSRDDLTAVRTICETESRLYSLSEESKLVPSFDDMGKSMIRRQDVGIKYKVFSTDIFRFNKNNLNNTFLGNSIVGIPIDKICGLDIDDESDFMIVKSLVESNCVIVKKYL